MPKGRGFTPNFDNYSSPCRFRTAHREGPSALRGACGTIHLAGAVGNRTHPKSFGDFFASLGTFAPIQPVVPAILRVFSFARLPPCLCPNFLGMEPRGGIEPPHVHGVVHGRRFRFCYCTRHICRLKSRAKSLLQSCSVNLNGWFFALPRLDFHTRTNAGSFQQVSAGAGHDCHHFRPHDRRASSNFSCSVRRRLGCRYSVFPQPGPCTSGRKFNLQPENYRLQAPGRNRTGGIPYRRVALPTELPGHMCRSSPGGGGRARSGKKEGKQVARPSLELGSGLYRRAI